MGVFTSARFQHALLKGWHAWLAGSFLVAYVTADENTYAMHQFAGYAVLAAIVARLVGGLLAPAGSPLRLPRPDTKATLAWLSSGKGRHPLFAWSAVVLLAVVESAVVDGIGMQQVELNLIGDQWLVHARVQKIELMHIVVRHPRAEDLAFLHEPVQPLGGFVSAGEPVRPMHQQQVNVLDAHEPQGLFRALHQPRRRGIVEGGLAVRMVVARNVDAAFGDDLQLLAQRGIQLQGLADELLHLVQAVNLRRVDRGDAQLHAFMQPL